MSHRQVAMPGGSKAIHEPWRNTLRAYRRCDRLGGYLRNYRGLELTRFLQAKPLTTLDMMMANAINGPRAS
jgi:hydrogenase maturation protein HypF